MPLEYFSSYFFTWLREDALIVKENNFLNSLSEVDLDPADSEKPFVMRNSVCRWMQSFH
jgi:hypothetical protein